MLTTDLYETPEYQTAQEVAAKIQGYADLEWRDGELYGKGAKNPEVAYPIPDVLRKLTSLIAIGFYVGSPDKRDFSLSGTTERRERLAREIADTLDFYDPHPAD